MTTRRDDRPGFTPAEKSEREARADAILDTLAEPLTAEAAEAAGIKLYDVTVNGRRVRVTIPED